MAECQQFYMWRNTCGVLSFWRATTACAYKTINRVSRIGYYLLALFFLPQQVTANAAQICDEVAQIAAQETGVPVSVLRAITRVETGRTKSKQLQPWPWTVNMEGKGVWFDTEDEARGYVFKHFKRGARSFDVGCFQINYKWHGQAFESIDQMFEPLANARYAAAFLQRLFNETNDWTDAAGAYHSRTPEYANKYKARFDRVRLAVTGAPLTNQPDKLPTQGPVSHPKSVNRFPLLLAGIQPGQLGSLVPHEKTQTARQFISFSTPEG